MEQRVIDGLKIGNEALKKAHEILNIDEIEKIMDDTREGVEKQRVSIYLSSLKVKIMVCLGSKITILSKNSIKVWYPLSKMLVIDFFLQEIDIMLSGALTSEDEEDVENEYESMIAQLMPSTPRDATEESLNLPEVPSDIEEVEGELTIISKY